MIYLGLFLHRRKAEIMDSHRKVSHIPGYQSNRWFFIAIMKNISSFPQKKKNKKITPLLLCSIGNVNFKCHQRFCQCLD